MFQAFLECFCPSFQDVSTARSLPEKKEENKLRSAGVERGSARPSFARMSMVAGALMSEYLNAHESTRSGAYDPATGGRVGIRKLWTARSRLYRSRLLEVNTRLRALDEFYKIYVLLHRSDISI